MTFPVVLKMDVNHFVKRYIVANVIDSEEVNFLCGIIFNQAVDKLADIHSQVSECYDGMYNKRNNRAYCK